MSVDLTHSATEALVPRNTLPSIPLATQKPCHSLDLKLRQLEGALAASTGGDDSVEFM